jgi:hypothetical protein
MPTLSSDMPDYVADEIEFEPTSPEYQSPERLESIADYAATLAEWKLEQEAPSGDGGGSGDQDGDGGALSEEEEQELRNRDDVDLNEYDVPQKAYLVKKEVDNNLYYYYQWRKGPSQWGSKYICPVNPV